MPYAFSTVAVPNIHGAGRKPEANPFLEPVGTLIDADGLPLDEALSFTIPDLTWESAEVQKITRQLARAGKVHNVSVFKTLDATEDGLGTVVTFWAQNRILTGGRKPKDEAPAPAVAAPASDW